MLEIFISLIISIIILLIGFYLAKITKEELKESFENFINAIIITNTVSIFIILFFLKIKILFIYPILFIFIIIFYKSKTKIKLMISTITYIISAIFLTIKFDNFLLASTIIQGFLISSIYYYKKYEKINKL